MFPSCFPSSCRLSPLFYEGDQIFIFPAPISCLGKRLICRLPTRLSAKAVPRHKARCAAAHSRAESRIIGVLVRTVLQLGLTVQSADKKRCGRRVGELRNGNWGGGNPKIAVAGFHYVQRLVSDSSCSPKYHFRHRNFVPGFPPSIDKLSSSRDLGQPHQLSLLCDHDTRRIPGARTGRQDGRRRFLRPIQPQ